MIFFKKKARTQVNNLVFILILTLMINPYFAPPIYAVDGQQPVATQAGQAPTAAQTPQATIPAVPNQPAQQLTSAQPAPAPVPTTTTFQPFLTTIAAPTTPLSTATLTTQTQTPTDTTATPTSSTLLSSAFTTQTQTPTTSTTLLDQNGKPIGSIYIDGKTARVVGQDGTEQNYEDIALISQLIEASSSVIEAMINGRTYIGTIINPDSKFGEKLDVYGRPGQSESKPASDSTTSMITSQQGAAPAPTQTPTSLVSMAGYGGSTTPAPTPDPGSSVLPSMMAFQAPSTPTTSTVANATTTPATPVYLQGRPITNETTSSARTYVMQGRPIKLNEPPSPATDTTSAPPATSTVTNARIGDDKYVMQGKPYKYDETTSPAPATTPITLTGTSGGGQLAGSTTSMMPFFQQEAAPATTPAVAQGKPITNETTSPAKMGDYGRSKIDTTNKLGINDKNIGVTKDTPPIPIESTPPPLPITLASVSGVSGMPGYEQFIRSAVSSMMKFFPGGAAQGEPDFLKDQQLAKNQTTSILLGMPQGGGDWSKPTRDQYNAWRDRQLNGYRITHADGTFTDMPPMDAKDIMSYNRWSSLSPLDGGGMMQGRPQQGGTGQVGGRPAVGFEPGSGAPALGGSDLRGFPNAGPGATASSGLAAGILRPAQAAASPAAGPATARGAGGSAARDPGPSVDLFLPFGALIPAGLPSPQAPGAGEPASPVAGPAPLAPANKPAPPKKSFQNDTEFFDRLFVQKPFLPLSKPLSSIFFEQPPGSPGGNPSPPEPLPFLVGTTIYYYGQGPDGPLFGDAGGPWGTDGASLNKPPGYKPPGFPQVTEGPPLNPVEYIKKQYPFPKPKPGPFFWGDQVPYTGPVYVPEEPEAKALYEEMIKAMVEENKKINNLKPPMPKPTVAPIVSIGSQLLWGLGVVATFYVVADTVIDLVTHAIVQSYNNQNNVISPGLNLKQFEQGLASIKLYPGMRPDAIEEQVSELERLLGAFPAKDLTKTHIENLTKIIVSLNKKITELVTSTPPGAIIKPADKVALERLYILRLRLSAMLKFLSYYYPKS